MELWVIMLCKALIRVKLCICLSAMPCRGIVGLEIDGKFLACFCQGGSGWGFVVHGSKQDESPLHRELLVVICPLTLCCSI